MFDNGLVSADDGAVVAAIEEWAVTEAKAAAHRVAAIGELVRRRCSEDERDHWACDSWDAAAAEVSAALGIPHGRASGEMHLSQAMRYRLPQVGALFMAGRLSYAVCRAISWRTMHVEDDEALALIDTALAQAAVMWGPMSDYKLAQAIDVWIDRYDPAALRRTRATARSRDVRLGSKDVEAGTTALTGRLFSTDAALLDRRLTQMAHTVCDDDPRTIGQRRADALGALAAGSDRLTCTCGSPECPSGADDGRASSIVIHVLTEAEALAGEPDPAMSGEPERRRVTRDTPLAEALAPRPEPEPTSTPATAVLTGRGGIVTPAHLAQLIRSGATVRNVRRPSDKPEPGYRPSAALAEFVRLRDMTCRFPNCDVPAEFCDIDHTVPWPYGPTHPSNLSCKCRKHHLLKTFWDGWSDRQLPDGTLIWTSPAGRTYVTRPGSRLLIPQWRTTTADLPAPSGTPPRATGLTMPTRRRTRAAQRAARITRERAMNAAYVTDRNAPAPF
ncbi:HNH endonuclease signature motif containing protein [Mycobacterium sp. M26]|uniref:HNH endonuclease signature motif containing protein n=1 Tax=Mycobacterium sp. M26 TaxID=1762962 RepID=UPI00073E20D9|nr:HNH endonuclease signature motif containing protein [Mycobacterium sp. M26]